jgi:CsoR family transcriptional regulator, copper-sensing transcriptional repressor
VTPGRPVSPFSMRVAHEAHVIPSTGMSTRCRSPFGVAVPAWLIPDSIPPYPISPSGERAMRGYSMHKDDYRTRLRRIEGQVRGLQRMVDEDEYCVDILTQIVSVTKALQGVGLGLLDEHLRSCVRDAAESSRAEGDAKLTEAVQAVERLLKV